MGNALSYCDANDATGTQSEAPLKDSAPQATAEDVGETVEEQAEEEAEEEAPRTYPKKPKFWSPPPDPRFRSVNQARTCYTRYNEFYKCKLEKDEESDECKFYRRCYESICPEEWIERWEELREEGLWAGRY